MIDLPALKRRCRLPRGALSRFVELNRRGIDSVTVLLLDGLAPSEHARGTFVSRSGGSIPDMIARLLSLFPSAMVEFPVFTMQPDEADRGHPAPLVAERYGSLVRSFSGWSEAKFRALPRNDWYKMLVQPEGIPENQHDPPLHFFFIHEDETPYGNIAFIVNPAASITLKMLPSFLPAQFFDVLSWAGHSERIAIVPRQSPLLRSFVGQVDRAHQSFSLAEGITVMQVAQAIAGLWVPDVHVQAAWDVITRPLCIWTGHEDYRIALKPFQEGAWRYENLLEGFDEAQFQKALNGNRTVAVLVADTDEGDWGGASAHLLMVNGTSGAKGGF